MSRLSLAPSTRWGLDGQRQLAALEVLLVELGSKGVERSTGRVA